MSEAELRVVINGRDATMAKCCRFCGRRFTSAAQYYTDDLGYSCRNGKACITREEKRDLEQGHVHRWIVQSEDEPEHAYLVCIQCGEVVDPRETLAMLEIVQTVADGLLYYDTQRYTLSVSEPETLVEKARKLLNERATLQ